MSNAQSFLKPNNTREFAPYQSTVDVNRYESLIREKQNKYDQNLERINGYIAEIDDYLLEIKEYHYDNYVKNKNLINNYLKETFNKKPDLSNQYVYETISGTLKRYISGLKSNLKTFKDLN